MNSGGQPPMVGEGYSSKQGEFTPFSHVKEFLNSRQGTLDSLFMKENLKTNKHENSQIQNTNKTNETMTIRNWDF